MGDWNATLAFIWSVKEILRDHYRRHQYGQVILPLCVLRRLDCVLEPTRDRVLAKAKTVRGNLDGAKDLLAHTAGLSFYNTSRHSFAGLLGDPDNVAANLSSYLLGFSPNVRDVVDKFGLHPHIEKMDRAGILYAVLRRFAEIDLHPGVVSNLEMGYLYEELVREVADLSNEEAGEHFTPREVIRLMVNLLLADERDLHTPGRVFTVLDPACGTGGMLTEAERRIRELNPSAHVHLFGQEVNDESYAICRSDLLMSGEDAANIRLANTLTTDAFGDRRFDYVLANPPYGKDWKTEQAQVRAEHRTLGFAGRYGAGLPPTSDGQLLFLQHMLAKLRPAEDGGGRVGVVMNGSPLFSGDAGSGPSEVRRYVCEHDLLDAIVALPDQLFYNTGIFTYVWILSNAKPPERAGHALLIDARQMYAKMRKSLGNKRNELTDAHIAEITHRYESYAETEHAKVVPTTTFGFRKITVERPLRLRWEVSEATRQAVAATRAFRGLGEEERTALLDGLAAYDGFSSVDRDEFERKIAEPLLAAGLVRSAERKPVLDALSVRDPDVPPVLGRDGTPEPDAQLRDTENVPLDENVDTYVEREVLPFVPDAWIDESKERIGYEIPFTRLFYRYVPPRPLAEIDAEIKASQQRILALIAEVAE